MAGSIRNARAPEPQGVTDDRKAALVAEIVRGELTPQQACERYGISDPELKQWVRAYARAARRAVDDQLAAALAAHGLEVDEQPASEFSGSIDEMAVAELIQTIQFGRKDAQVRVDHDGERSYLWCVDGDVVDASSARLTGAAAVYRVLSLRRGRIHADFSPVKRARTIHASTQALMLEAAKRSDECVEIRARLGDTLNLYVPSSSAPPDSEIEPDQAEVLRAFDGTRSIEQVVHDSAFPDLETLGMVAQLLDREWLVPKSVAAQRPARSTAAPVTGAETSYSPLAASLVGRSSAALPSPRRLWFSVAAGIGVVAVAFTIGFYSAPSGDAAPGALAPVEPARSVPACGSRSVLLAGGVCLDRAVISAAEYQTCVRAGACEPAQRELDSASPGAPLAAAAANPAAALNEPPPRAEAAARCNAGASGRDSYPANCVTPQQAQRYCDWRGGRLPRRSEWELAAAAHGSELPDVGRGISEWALDGAPASTGYPEPARERFVVLGAGPGSGLSRLNMNANARGRGVGFRCIVALEPPAAVAGAAHE